MTADVEERVAFAEKIRALEPNNPQLLALTQDIIGAEVAAWHFGCLDDIARNQAYEKALNNLVTPETIVLDVGAGCGVLSLFAARAGAKHVYAVEINPVMAQKAREIVQLNKLDDQITIIQKDILDVKLGEDIPERCDLVVQDIIWPDPLSRNIHNLLSYCELTQVCMS